MTQNLLFHVVISALISQGQGAVNFALNKYANQSTTLTYEGFDWTADKAVDGNSNGSNPDSSRTCSATIARSNEIHAWEVDIGVQIIVKTITVYGRTDENKDQLDGVTLYLGNTSGPWNYGQEVTSDPSSGTPLIQYVFKPHNVIARFISLKRFGNILTICEVNVEGECRRGTYGPGCNEICGNCYKGDNSCSVNDGRCVEGCETGWHGDTCKLKCRRGTYGSGCNETCGNCYKGNTSCSMNDGRCTEGCEIGWRDDKCKLKCAAGTYGFNCSETCGYCLNGNEYCSHTNGQCSDGCQTGWKGETCKSECEIGTFGLNCSETCGYCLNGNNSCSKISGECSGGCQTGWRGEACKSECKAGTYGFNCNETCGYCLNGNNSCSHINGQCSDGCQAGWTGETCKTECEVGTYGFNCNEPCGYCFKGKHSCLHINGQCNGGCQTGWRGETCKSECEVGTYGFNCNETCGYCSNANKSCSNTSGQCSGGCQTGWKGETCKSECEVGTYGINCNETCGYCLNGNKSCSKISGQCSGGCQTGWKGETCKSECKVGTYGFNCNETCGYCLNGNKSCSKISGQCSDGCQTMWRGETCKSGMLETVTPADDGPNTGAIVGSVLAAVGVSISATVILIVIVKKRKRNNNETGTETVTPATNYANLVVGNPDAAMKISVCSREERETAFTAIAEASLQKEMPIGVTNSHSDVMEPDVPVHNVYEKLRDVTESTESPYYTIDHNLLNDQKMNTIENCSNYIETLQELESALKRIEEEISTLRDRKEKLLCKELESSRAIKLRDERKETDSTQSDTYKDSTYVNEESRDALEGCGKYVQMLQSLEGELRMLVEKRKCLFQRKETLLRQELSKTSKI